MRQLGVIAVPSANPTLTSLCENYVGRVGPQSPTGRLLFSTPKSLLVAGCGLVARPTRQFSHRLLRMGLSLVFDVFQQLGLVGVTFQDLHAIAGAESRRPEFSIRGREVFFFFQQR